ncbi:MAG: hypothetical protein ABIG43_07300 [Chloroflexota bacterium]
MVQKKQFPFYVFLFSIYPALALLATNIAEVDIRVVSRPLFASLILASLLFVIMRLILKNWQQAALITAVILVFFFSYGHVYDLVRQISFALARHRYIIPIYVVLFGILLWYAIKKVKDVHGIAVVMNIVSIALLIFPIYKIISFAISNAHQEQSISEKSDLVQLTPPSAMPDVYYIVLDTYMREDALLRDMDFDNSSFINGLEGMGFYVADCSRSNYSYTLGSMTSALNLAYLSDLNLENLKNPWILLKQSQTRRQLEEIGYRTVAFETSYEWSRLDDADILLGIGRDPANLQTLYPFEVMFLKTTAFLMPLDLNLKILSNGAGDGMFEYQYHIDLELFILNELPKIPKIPGPKFVFVHILIPHVPYVFDPQGEIRTDSGFYSGKLATAIDEEYLMTGYNGEIEFINAQMLNVFNIIIKESSAPPIIIMHGDHGLRDDNRLQILNAYYLPGDGNLNLYPSITPVNSFRIMFNTYFGTNYDILPDLGYHGEPLMLIPETAPECQK